MRRTLAVRESGSWCNRVPATTGEAVREASSRRRLQPAHHLTWRAEAEPANSYSSRSRNHGEEAFWSSQTVRATLEGLELRTRSFARGPHWRLAAGRMRQTARARGGRSNWWEVRRDLEVANLFGVSSFVVELTFVDSATHFRQQLRQACKLQTTSWRHTQAARTAYAQPQFGTL